MSRYSHDRDRDRDRDRVVCCVLCFVSALLRYTHSRLAPSFAALDATGGEAERGRAQEHNTGITGCTPRPSLRAAELPVPQLTLARTRHNSWNCCGFVSLSIPVPAVPQLMWL